MIFGRRKRSAASGSTLAEPRPAASGDQPASAQGIGGNGHDPAADRQLLRERHLAGIELLEATRREAEAGRAAPPLVEPAEFREWDGDLPEIEASELTAPLARAAILDRGCLLVRGLIEPEQATAIAAAIERALAAWEAAQNEDPHPEGLYEPFVPEPPFEVVEREWVNSAGGIWTADSPRLSAEVLALFERTGLARLAAEYLGERPLLSVQKGTLRRVEPTAGRGWHQDGAFLGEVKALNTWLALSRCGVDAPGMDIVARRLEHLIPTGTEGATFDWSVSEQLAREAAGEAPIVRPQIEPGDLVLFDELCLHTTAAEPSMPNPRYAIETWFFGASAYPDRYVPIAPLSGT